MVQRATVGQATVRQIDHIAVAVRDAELAAAHLTDRFGLRRLSAESLSSPPVYLVHLDAGTVALQLVEPRGPGVVADFIDNHGEGLHHICFAVETIEPALQALGASSAQVFVGGGGRRACFLPDAGFGLVIELIEPVVLQAGMDRAADNEPLPIRRRVIVIDDDPTGTQSAAGVRILLDPNLGDFRTFFGGGERAIYVLTNSRSLSETEAVDRVRTIERLVRDAAEATGSEYQIVLRGDSTLRGHVIAELDAVDDGRSIIIFAPAFPDGGRTTVDGIQFAEVEGRRMPVDHTEFARDPIFGYATSDLREWVRQRAPRRTVVLIPIATVRRGPDAVADALAAMSVGTIAIPDAETTDDLQIIEAGLRLAEAGGARILARTASTLAAMRADLKPGLIRKIWAGEPGRVLVVCGSHTNASTRQLDVLAAVRGLAIETLSSDGRENGGVASRLADRLDRDGIAILATPRERAAADGSVQAGRRMMDRLGEVVGRVTDHVDGIIAKGGITSAHVALTIGARDATVVGQLEVGVPLWQLELPRQRPYAVVPGNVGDSDLLVRLVDRFLEAGSAHASRSLVRAELR